VNKRERTAFEILVWEDARCFLEYGVERNHANEKTQIANLKSGLPFDFTFEMPEKDMRYYYRLVYQAGDVFKKSVSTRFKPNAVPVSRLCLRFKRIRILMKTPAVKFI
jgi:hypothetical protein